MFSATSGDENLIKMMDPYFILRNNYHLHLFVITYRGSQVHDSLQVNLRVGVSLLIPIRRSKSTTSTLNKTSFSPKTITKDDQIRNMTIGLQRFLIKDVRVFVNNLYERTAPTIPPYPFMFKGIPSR